MVNMEVVERADGTFVVRAIGGSTLEDDSEPFATREEADEWMLDRTERLSINDGPHTLRPGGGQGPIST
jgi:hypothetical protein